MDPYYDRVIQVHPGLVGVRIGREVTALRRPGIRDKTRCSEDSKKDGEPHNFRDSVEKYLG